MNRRQVTACFFMAFFPLILNFNSLVHGRQDGKSDTFLSSDFFTTKLRSANIYEIRQAGSQLTVRFSVYHGFGGIDYRFLSFPEIQEELNLTDRQRAHLRSIFEEIFEYDIVWSCELACACAPARLQATERVADLMSRVENRVFLKGLLTNEQLDRLVQIENRFAVYCPQEMGRLGDKILGPLALDSQQLARISDVVIKSLDEISVANEEWEKTVLSEALKSYLGDERFDQLNRLSGGAWFSREPLIRSAQMSPIFSFGMIEDFENNSAAKFLASDKREFRIFDPLILPNGRIVSRADYSERSQLSSIRSDWQDLVLRILEASESEADWFSLSDSQIDALASLYYIEESEQGAASVVFVGPPLPEMPQDALTSLPAYRRFINQKLEWARSVDLSIERAVRSTLVPRQLEQIQFAIGASQFRALGVQVTLAEKLLGVNFEISKDELLELQRLVLDRKKLEHKEFQRIESLVVDELSDEQRKVFRKLFGDPSELFPSFVSHWRGDSLNYKK